MKKIVCTLLVVLLLTAIVSVTAVAGGYGAVSVTADESTVYPGGEFNVTVSYSDHVIQGFGIKLIYDAEVLEWTGITKGSSLSAYDDYGPQEVFVVGKTASWTIMPPASAEQNVSVSDLFKATFKFKDGVAVDTEATVSIQVTDLFTDETDFPGGVTTGTATVKLVADPNAPCTHDGTIKTVDAVNASCITKTDGNTAYYECTVCHKFFSDSAGANEITNKSSVVVAWQHTLSKVNGQAATCTENGVEEHYKCSVCGKLFEDAKGEIEISEDEVLIPAGHKLTKVEAKAATCKEQGNKEYWECSVCHKFFSDAEGNSEITDKESVKTDFAAHTITAVTAVDPTCTEAGNTAYYKCTVCDKYFEDADGKTEITDKDSVIVDSLGHQLPLKDYPAVPATYEKAGTEAYWECERDNCHRLFSDAEAKNEIAAPIEIKKLDAPAIEIGSDKGVEVVLPAGTKAGDVSSVKIGDKELTSDQYEVTEDGKLIIKNAAVKDLAKGSYTIAIGLSGVTGTYDVPLNVTEKAEQPTNTPTGNGKNVTKTGDETNIALWIGVLALCGVGAAVVLGKKKSNG